MTADAAAPPDDRVDILVLGPVVLRHRGRAIALPSRGARTLLGNLAAEPRRELSDDVLHLRMWPQRPEGDGTKALRVAVHRLRHWLHTTVGDAVVVRRTTRGYALDLRSGEIDAERFRALLARSAAVPPAGRTDLLAEALDFWRGPALVDVPQESADATVLQQLANQRAAASREFARLTIDAGHADRALYALAPLVAEDPLNEALQAAWFEALAASGQQAAALEAYELLRVRLRDELGVEPSREVSRALVKVLQHEEREQAPAPGAAEVPDRPAPAQLPAVAHAFTGRTRYLRELDALLGGDDGNGGGGAGAPTAILVTAISGAGGVGKTALAVRWGHRVAHRFPDGQIYVDLHGVSRDQQARPVTVLGRILRDIGLSDAQVPRDGEEAASLYRSVLAGRRMLIVLDNAASAQQVRPLIPGAPGCLVLVTSRAELGGLVAVDGARRIDLDVLEPAESVELLAGLLGPATVEAQPEAVADLAAACAHLPLALRIAAANLARHPGRGVAAFVRRLRGGERWQALTVPGDDRATVRLAFDQSYELLSEPARTLFRTLGLVPGTDVTAAVAAIACGWSDAEVRRPLAELVDAHLLTEHVPGRYVFHDLLRAYARELGEREAPDPDGPWLACAAAYLAGADRARRRLHPRVLRLPGAPSGDGPGPSFADDESAEEWLSAELVNLVAVAGDAAAHGAPEIAWQLCDALRMHLFRRRLTAEFDQIAAAAGAAARAAGDAPGCAVAELAVATACRSRGDLPRALHHLRTALAHSEEAGWTESRVATLSNISIVQTEMGDLHLAVASLEEVRALNQELGDRAREATAFNNLGGIQYQSGRLVDAVASFRRALEIYREVGDGSADALTLHNLGRALRDTGLLEEASTALSAALRTAHAAGDRHIEAGALIDMAILDWQQGRSAAARRRADRALALADGVRDTFEQVSALLCLAGLDTGDGALDAALSRYEAGLALATETGQRGRAAEAMIGIGQVHHLRGDRDRAARAAREAVARCHELGLRLLEGHALRLLADVNRAAGALDRAATLAGRAVSLHASSDHPLGVARALQSLRDVDREAGRAATAALSDRRATEILDRIRAVPERFPEQAG